MPRSAIERFAEKCHFDPATGCVLWSGALSNGKGSSSIYGRFWYKGKSWYAHLWAAKFIHDIEVGPCDQVDHCCKISGERRPNSLCVQHLQAIPQMVNLRLRWSDYWQYWGGEEDEMEEAAAIATDPDPGDVPFFVMPEWLRPFHETDGNKGTENECPF